MMYEAYYSYPINDGMTVTPLIYTKDMATGTDDQTGIMVKTSFSFCLLYTSPSPRDPT